MSAAATAGPASSKPLELAHLDAALNQPPPGFQVLEVGPGGVLFQVDEPYRERRPAHGPDYELTVLVPLCSPIFSQACVNWEVLLLHLYLRRVACAATPNPSPNPSPNPNPN